MKTITANPREKNTPASQKVPKQFITCLNKLTVAQKKGLTKFEIQALLYELEEVAFEHFKSEHNRLLNFDKTIVSQQAKQHNTFLLKIQDFAFEYLYGTHSNFPGFIKYLKHWVDTYSVVNKEVVLR